MNDRDVKIGLAAGLGLFMSVLVTDLATDKFNLSDHFSAQTENAYRVLFFGSLAVGGIGGGGLGAAARNMSQRARNTRPAALPA